MNLIKRLKNLWKISGQGTKAELSFVSDDLRVMPLPKQNLAQIIKLRPTDPVEEALKNDN